MAVWTIADAAKHVGHEVKLVIYGNLPMPVDTTVECIVCGEVLVSFEDVEMLTGRRPPELSSRDKTVDENDVCPECNGNGYFDDHGDPPVVCTVCGGNGILPEELRNV